MTKLMERKSGLVTAAGSGIGRASALAFANAGAQVMVSDVNEETGNETVKIIKDNGGEAEFFKCDVTDEQQVKALVDKTVSTFGKLDFAHNNAGLSFSQGKIGDTDYSDWQKTLKLTLDSVFLGMKHQVKADENLYLKRKYKIFKKEKLPIEQLKDGRHIKTQSEVSKRKLNFIAIFALVHSVEYASKCIEIKISTIDRWIADDIIFKNNYNYILKHIKRS